MNYKVKAIKPLTGCSHEKDENGISEYALNLTLSKIGLGKEFTEEIFFKLLEESQMEEACMELVDEGLVNMTVKDGEIAFYLTEKGKERSEAL